MRLFLFAVTNFIYIEKSSLKEQKVPKVKKMKNCIQVLLFVDRIEIKQADLLVESAYLKGYIVIAYLAIVNSSIKRGHPITLSIT